MRALAIVLLLTACSASAGSATTARPSALRVVPQGMVGVALVGANSAPLETVTADELLAKEEHVHEEVGRVGPSAEGSPGIYFYGFDADRIVFFYGKLHRRCPQLGCIDYVADRLYVVPRTGGAEAKLKVEKQIALYEMPGDVRGGMHQADVRAKLGPPDRVEPLQTFGSERWYYPAQTILFLNGEVAAIEPPSSRP